MQFSLQRMLLGSRTEHIWCLTVLSVTMRQWKTPRVKLKQIAVQKTDSTYRMMSVDNLLSRSRPT